MPDNVTLDDKLVEAIQNGDQTALGRVIEKYAAYVGTIVWNIVQDKLTKADAEEIVSDVFLILWRSADKVHPGKLKSYLSVIARRRSINALRGAKLDAPLEDEELPIMTPGPEDEYLRQSEYEALRQTVDELPEPDRTIFIRHYYFYQKTAEIAAALGINVNTVKKKLSRGRERLRQELSEGGYFIG